MTISTDLHVIEPIGALAGIKAPELRQQAIAAFENGAKILLIDLKGTTFVDSSGLGALIMCLKAARSADAQLHLCSINHQIHMLFELTSMDRVFEVFEDRADFEAVVLK